MRARHVIRVRLACRSLMLVLLAMVASTTPAEATPLPGVLPSNAQDGRIAAGNDHTCAISAQGGIVRCWGRDGEGQLVVPEDLGPAVMVTAGENDTCAVAANRTVRCWGSNAAGQATVPEDLGTVTQVDAGIDATCAIKSDATVRCWGDARVAAPANLGSATDISVGGQGACAIKPDGTVACWGANSFIKAVPSDLGTVTQISVGELHACAIKTGGTVQCWGYDGSGQATRPPGLGPVTRVVASVNTCVIKVDGDAQCWGSPGAALPTAPPDGVGPPLQLAVGVTHACALKASGTVQCWGASDVGQLAVPNELGTVSRPVVATGTAFACATRSNGTGTCTSPFLPQPAGPVKAVYADAGGTCFIGMDNLISCRSLWVDLIPSDLGPVLEVSLSSNGDCALRLSGSSVCWGNIGYDLIRNAGNGPGRQINIRRDAGCLVGADGRPACWDGSTSTGSDLITRLSGGFDHACWLTGANTVSCSGTIASPPAGRFLDLDSGVFHACGVSESGTVRCWGGDNAEADVPADLGAVVQIAVNNQDSSCAVRVDGTVRCWGAAGVGLTGGLVDVADATPPATTDDVPAWANGPVAVTLAASDTGGGAVAGTTYEVISAGGVAGPTQTYSAAAKPLLSAGERIRYRSTDTARNVEANRTSAPLQVEQERPTTSDDVPDAWSTTPVAVTLDAADTGGSGVADTTYEILSSDGTPGATQTYSATSKPLLAHGERIRYRATDLAGNGSADRTSRAAKVDGSAPTTTDDVPAAAAPARVAVTLTAVDAGPSGVARTTYEIVGADGAAGPTKTYDASSKPVLAGGERIRYRSVDLAGNAEADVTSRALTVVPPPTPTSSPAPEPTLQPAPLPTLLPQTAPVITATLGADGKGRQVLLAKKWVTVKVGCGQVACTLTINGEILLRGKRIATLRPVTVTLQPGERRLIRIPTTLKQRRTIRRALGPNGTKSQARFTITATTLTTPPKTATATVTVGLRQVVAKG